MALATCTHEACPADVGIAETVELYVWHAEVAMNHYLGLDPPESLEEKDVMSEAAEGTVK